LEGQGELEGEAEIELQCIAKVESPQGEEEEVGAEEKDLSTQQEPAAVAAVEVQVPISGQEDSKKSQPEEEEVATEDDAETGLLLAGKNQEEKQSGTAASEHGLLHLPQTTDSAMNLAQGAVDPVAHVAHDAVEHVVHVVQLHCACCCNYDLLLAAVPTTTLLLRNVQLQVPHTAAVATRIPRNLPPSLVLLMLLVGG
jgi:hypothetical protein